MTNTTWIDPPNKKLDSYDEPLDFASLNSEISFVSVAYTPRGKDKLKYRSEEMVYRDGVFLWPFLRSTRVGNVFSVVRQGGWPAHPRPHVEPKPPTQTTFWTTLYELDCTTLASAAIAVSQGEYKALTIDGKAWSIHKAGNHSGANVVNGHGIIVPASTSQDSGNPYAGSSLSVIVSALAGYDAAKQTAVQVRMKAVNRSGQELSQTYRGASAWTDGGSPQWGYGPGNNRCVAYVYRGSSTVSGCSHIPGYFNALSYSGQRTYDALPITKLVSDYAYAMVVLPDRSAKQSFAYCKPGLSSFPAMEEMEPLGATTGGSGASHGGGLHMGAYFGSVNGVVVTDYYLTHLRVLQKAA